MKACAALRAACRRAGELLEALGERRGRPGKTNTCVSISSNKEFGISDMTSSRWQALAAIPEMEFDDM